MIKLLLGGSPCTHWSIAQTKNRETEPSGAGWELFKNYLIALEKYKPDYFLYENNKSMSAAIREQITKELGVEPILINSALVSAQNRQRLYWTNIPGVEQPKDRGILLRDILESGMFWREKAYTLRASAGTKQGISNVIKHIQTGGRFGYQGVCEPIYSPSGKMLTEAEMEYMVRETKNGRNHFAFEYFSDAGQDKSACVTANIHKGVPYNVCAEPIRVGTICGQGGGVGAKTGLYAVPSPCCVAQRGRYTKEDGGTEQHLEPRQDGKTNTLTTVQKDNLVLMPLNATPVHVGDMPTTEGRVTGSQSRRIYSVNGKTPTLISHKSGGNSDTSSPATGLYAIPTGIAWRGREDGNNYEVRNDQKANTVTADGHQSRLVNEDAAIFNNPHGFNKGGIKYEKSPTLTANGDWQHNNYIIEAADGKTYPVYAVKDGQITIKDKQYPIKLADGFYIIRKLTVTECKRLQTVPDDYVFPVSDTQAYKMLGNGWTVDVIAHILGYCPGITTEPLEVLSMYDGMSCGRLAFNKLGARISRYCATEIDKYAIKTTQTNFPDTIQLGDAFQVRNDDWYKRIFMEVEQWTKSKKQ